MAINIHVQDEQVTVNVVKGDLNTGKPAVLQEISVTKDGTYTPDFGVDGFSKVDVFVLPTDMLDGLEDGWDVMFYDEHKRGLASYSIKQGHTINAPVYDCKAWQLADGENIVFPYTPTGDVILYALISTYADQLYEFYGVDKGVYPYVVVSMPSSKSAFGYISFAKVIGNNTTSKLYGTTVKQGTFVASLENKDNIEEVVSFVMEKATTLTTYNEGVTYDIMKSGKYVYANFDVNFANLTHLERLDQ